MNLDGVVTTYVIMKYVIGGPKPVIAGLGILSGAVLINRNTAELLKSLNASKPA
jgi:hypothetical protein